MNTESTGQKQDPSETKSEEIARSLNALYEDGDVAELRCFRQRKTYAGFFDDFEKMAEEAADADEKRFDVYVTLNPCKEALLGRADNTLIEIDPKKTPLASDNDIERRRWILIDCDPKRPTKVSSTEEEKSLAEERAEDIRKYLLKDKGIYSGRADSGNGTHLLVPVDLPNDTQAAELVQGFLKALSFKFGDHLVGVDEGTYNAARITKTYGVVARKGQSVERIGRVHRRSKLSSDASYSMFSVNDLEKLQAVAKERPEEPKRGRGFKATDGNLDLHRWLPDHNVAVKRQGEWGADGYRWILEECIWNGHADNSAYVVQGKEGWIYAGCSHNSCKTGKNRWFDLREHYEPGAYDNRGAYGEYGDEKPPYASPGAPLGKKPPFSGSAYGAYGEYSDFLELPEAEPFPLDALPEPVREFVRQGSLSVGCPVDIVALPVLPVLSSAIGNSRRAQVKRGWTESATLFTSTIASPGSKKSPADKLAQKPVSEVEAELKAEFEEEKEEYKRALQQWQEDKKDGGATEEKPEHPVMKQVVVSDATIEALVVALAVNKRGLLVSRDELSGWARALDQYKGGKGSDRQQWLSLWINNAIRQNRKGASEPTIIPHPFASLHGGIQPAILPELIDNREDGLLDRFLMAYPETSRAPRYSEYEMDFGVEKAYELLYRDLLALSPSEDDSGEPVPKDIVFADDAQELLIKAINRLGEQAREPGFPTRLEGIWSKLEAYLVRLSLIVAMSRVVWARRSGELTHEVIERRDVLAATWLIKYFQSHARRVVMGVYGKDPKDRLSEDLARFLENRGGTFEGTPTELDNAFESEAKPGGPNNLIKAVKATASRVAWLSFSEKLQYYKNEDDKRTSKKVVNLSLKSPYSSYSPYANAQSGGFKPNGNGGPAYGEKTAPYSPYADDEDEITV